MPSFDLEFRISIAEKELTHLRELQSIMRSHQDAHDTSIASITKILQRTEEHLEKLTEAQTNLTLSQAVTEQKLQNLIEAMAREHANGKN